MLSVSHTSHNSIGEVLASNYRRLALSILLQALRDGVKPPVQHAYQREIIKKQSRRWILQDNKDFRLYCSLAGLEPERIRHCLRQRLKMAVCSHDDQTMPE